MPTRTDRAPTLRRPVEDDYDIFIARLSRKALASIEKHLEICETDATLGYGKLWKHLAGFLARLAPYAIEASGQQIVKFYIPDGKYRVQVFALEDSRKGSLNIYMPDITAGAVTRKLIKAIESEGQIYAVVGDAHARIDLQPITTDTPELPDFCKPMLGWGRRALRTTLTTTATEKQIRAVERLCELAAEGWPKVTPAPTAVGPA